MKAMRLHQPGLISDEPLLLDKIDRPTPGPGQIRLKVHMCGVCHTDLHTVEGELILPQLPVTPGHQVVGTVESLGLDATQHQIGDRVGVAWLNWACGQCDACHQGLENLCAEARFTGLHMDGGYAEYLVVDERFAYLLPETFSDAEIPIKSAVEVHPIEKANTILQRLKASQIRGAAVLQISEIR